MDRNLDEANSWRVMFPVLASVLVVLAIAKIMASHADGADVLYLLGAAAFVVLRGIGERLTDAFHEWAGAAVLGALSVGIATLGESPAEQAAPALGFAIALTMITSLRVYVVPIASLVVGSLILARGGNLAWLGLAVVAAVPLLVIRFGRDRRMHEEIEKVREQVENQTATMHERSQKLTAARDQAVIQMRAKTAFLAHMSHEIRTPLNGMIGTLTLMERTNLDTTQNVYLRQVSKSSQDLLAIVNDVLDLSKLEAGALELDATPYAIAAVLENVAEVHGPAALQKGVDLRLALDAQAFDIVRGDPLRLRHIISNLTSNAVKFTESGEVVVFAETLSRAPDGYRMRVGVRDTGKGIASEDIDRVMQPFAQADVSTTRQYGGTGLGLSIAQRLLALMNAELLVESEVNVGSTFAFELDVLKAGEADAAGYGLPLDGVTVALQLSDAPSPARAMLANLGAAVVETAKEAEVVIRADDGADAPESPSFVLATRDVAAHAMAAARGYDGVLLLPWTRRAIVDAVTPLLEAEIVQSIRPSAPVSGADGSPLRVLLAEDNDTNRMVMDGQLRIIGASCDAVINGQAAVDKWRSDGPYDVILMDLQMPVMDGYEATRAIRNGEREAAGAKTPIIAVTANALAGDDKRALGVGFDDYVTKPFTLELLREVVQRWGRTKSTSNVPPSPPAPTPFATAVAPPKMTNRP